MNKKTIFRVIALINFIVLIIVFLLYRNGSFDHYLYGANDRNLTSPNGGTPAKISKDSTSKKKDSLEYLRMASSKSMIIVDERKIMADPVKLLFDSTKISLHPEKQKIMYGSKSGKVFDLDLFLADSTRKQFKTKKETKQ